MVNFEKIRDRSWEREAGNYRGSKTNFILFLQIFYYLNGFVGNREGARRYKKVRLFKTQ